MSTSTTLDERVGQCYWETVSPWGRRVKDEKGQWFYGQGTGCHTGEWPGLQNQIPHFGRMMHHPNCFTSGCNLNVPPPLSIPCKAFFCVFLEGVSLQRGHWEMCFHQVMKRSVIKRNSPAFVFGAGNSYLLQIPNRVGKQRVDKDWGHTLHKETTIKWWRILLSLKLKPFLSWQVGGFCAQLQVFLCL